jgi:uncharacterized RDD family membrane protein YckC
MGSALLNTTSEAEFASGEESALRAGLPDAARPSDSADALRTQVAERLAAHRRRRGGEQAQSSPTASAPARTAKTRSAQIAATVAERYAQTQSYRAFLAAEAERAIQQARAAAEVAAMNAQAVAAAQQRLLEAFDEHADRTANHAAAQGAEVHESGLAETLQAASQPAITELRAPTELNLWPDLEPTPAATPHHKTQHRSRPQTPAGEARAHLEPRTSNLEPSAGLTVRLYEDTASAAHVDFGRTNRAAAARTNRTEERNEAEAHALDEEIAFRHAPVFEEPAGPPVPLPANLIEFPRQLIASRKARPRYAEGPLREEAESAPGDGQLRIFEVDPAQISTSPETDVAEAPEPQWTSIWLDAPPDAAQMQGDAPRDYTPAEEAVFGRAMPAPPIQAASIPRRVLAAAINATIVLTGVVAFAATFVAIATRGIDWHPGGSRLQAVRSIASSIAAQTGLQPAQAATIAVAAGAVLILLYQALFFRFSEATPGMRCVRIGLCTFDDNNPTRRAIRRRALAVLISTCPLGLGFIFAMLDEDRLTWHDRITKMYLRSY